MKQKFASLIEAIWKPREREKGFSPQWVMQALHSTIMPFFVSYIKEERRMRGALTNIKYLRSHVVPRLIAKDVSDLLLVHELEHMLLNQEMKFTAALFRTESRGTHYREDYPARIDKEWLCWVDIHQDANGEMTVSKRPIPKEWQPTGKYTDRYPHRFPGEDTYLVEHDIS